MRFVGVILAYATFVMVLAALVPPPRLHLIRYHGVLTPYSADRAAIVPAGVARDEEEGSAPCCGALLRRPAAAPCCGALLRRPAAAPCRTPPPPSAPTASAGPSC